jgi:type III secretion HrpO family protein
MSVEEIIHLTQTSVWMMVLITTPPLLGAAAVGLSVGLFQTLTQIQDASLAFVFKIFVVTAILVSSSGWYGAVLLEFCENVLTDFPMMTR